MDSSADPRLRRRAPQNASRVARGMTSAPSPEQQTQRRWLTPPAMEEWARKEHIRYMRGLKLSGFAVIGWGTYNLSAAVIGADLAMIAVGFWFWRLAGGPVEVGLGLRETTLRGDQAAATTEPVPPPALLPPEDQQQPPA